MKYIQFLIIIFGCIAFTSSSIAKQQLTFKTLLNQIFHEDKDLKEAEKEAFWECMMNKVKPESTKSHKDTVRQYCISKVSKVRKSSLKCYGKLFVKEGNANREIGDKKIHFIVTLRSDKIVKIIIPDENIINISLKNKGKYLETKESVRVTNKPKSINVFQSTSFDNDEGVGGAYHRLYLDKNFNKVAFSIQSWNHKTKGKSSDTENYSMGLKERASCKQTKNP